MFKIKLFLFELSGAMGAFFLLPLMVLWLLGYFDVVIK